jgi:Spy/CpxP family protein refolding chaperone
MRKIIFLFIAAFSLIGVFACTACAKSELENNNCLPEDYNGLNLSVEQQQRIIAIRQEFEKDTSSLKNDLRIKNNELRQLWAAEPLNQSAIDNKTKEINGLRIQLVAKRRAMFARMKAVLTPEQIAKLKNYVKNHHMRGLRVRSNEN